MKDRHDVILFLDYLSYSTKNKELARFSCDVPDIIQIKENQQVWCLGDVHGDFDALYYSLYTAGLVNDEGYWTGGNSIVVQMGDVFDGKRSSDIPYPGESMMLDYLSNLDALARLSGGAVVRCIGNHDFYRLIRVYSKDQKEPIKGLYDIKEVNNFYDHFLSDFNRSDFDRGESLTSTETYTGYYRRLIGSCGGKLLLVLKWPNGEGVLCSHGGVDMKWIKDIHKGMKKHVKEINKFYKLDKEDEINIDNTENFISFINRLFSFFLLMWSGDKGPLTPFKNTIKYLIESLRKADSIIFSRPIKEGPDEKPTPTSMKDILKEDVCENCTKVLDFFGLNADQSICVSGHTPLLEYHFQKLPPEVYKKFLQNPSKIYTPCTKGRPNVFVTDASMSKSFRDDWRAAYNSRPQILEIKRDEEGKIITNVKVYDKPTPKTLMFRYVDPILLSQNWSWDEDMPHYSTDADMNQEARIRNHPVHSFKEKKRGSPKQQKSKKKGTPKPTPKSKTKSTPKSTPKSKVKAKTTPP